MAGDAGGGGATTKSPSYALTHQRMRNSAATKKWHVATLGGPIAEASSSDG